MHVLRALVVSSLAALLLLLVCVPTLFSSLEPARAEAFDAARSAGAAEPDAVAGDQRRHAGRAGYTAPVGTRFAYELRLEVGLGLAGQASGGTAPFAVTIAGPMHVLVLGRREREVLVGYRTPAVSIAVVGDAQKATIEWAEALQHAMRQGFDVRMDDRGVASAVRFAGEWTSDQRNFARALLHAFRFEFQASGTWSSSFDDAMGQHAFTYVAGAEGDDVIVERTRMAFMPLHAGGEASAAVQQHGTGNASFAASLQWLSEAMVDDAVAWSWLDGAVRVSCSSHGVLRCAGSHTVEVVADWDTDFQDAVGRAEVSAVAGDPMRGFWDERLRGLDVPVLLQRLRAFVDSKQEPSQEFHELLQMLAELVRRDPSEADRLAQLVQQARLTGQAAADVLTVLGMAGHARAQAALATVFENGLVEAGLRRAAVESMIQIEQPEPSLIASLQRSLYGSGRLEPLAGSAMLALGAFGSRGATTAEGRALACELLGLEAAARRDGVEGAFFEALGNTGDTAVIPLAQRLLQASDPFERARALVVLRRVRAPAAEAIVQAVARGDVIAEVRRAAVQVIGESTAASARDVLIERATADADSEVRRAAYSALATRARTDAIARAALEQRLQREAEPDLQQMLRSLLGRA